jgi:steroid delta-isomerase-like uncharacterized protein
VLVSQTNANEQLIRRWFDEVWNRKTESAIDEMLTEDCVAYGLPDPDAVVRGPDEFKQFHRGFCGAFPDLQIGVEDVIASGDRVAARWRMTGTHLGGNLGFPPTAKSVTLEGVSIAVIKDGKLKEGWNMMDMGRFFEALRGDGARF